MLRFPVFRYSVTRLQAKESSEDTLASWERLIDNAHLFGVDLITGFTGRLDGWAYRRIDSSI